MKTDFILRIHNYDRKTSLQDIDQITISGITLVSKQEKFGGVCMHKGNQKRFGYSIELSKNFKSVAGSHSYPILFFTGDHLDILIKNFPRYPAFYQDKNAARSVLTGWGYNDYMNKGFPSYLLYRKLEIIPLNN